MANIELTLSSPERLEKILNEAEEELKMLQPQIEALEDAAEKLRELKQTKQRLLTLKMSISAMLDNMTLDNVKEVNENKTTTFSETKLYNFNELSALKTFHPDEALQKVSDILKHKSSLNYELFKAVVFKGGKATTEEIKAFLIESDIKQPQSGESFESVPLTEISSRINYLVRKGVLKPMDRGTFYATLGWVEPD